MKSRRPHILRYGFTVRILALTLLGAGIIVPPVQAQQGAVDWSPWTLTAREINAMGAVRLSEVLRMMPAVETWSSDRYTLRFLGIGMGGQHPGGPGVKLDGVALPAFFLDRVLTESLPVSPGELGRVTWKPGLSAMPGSRMAEGKLILTTPMLKGWHVRGAMAVINETGDPGPAKHTDARRNNVDRSGPATWLRIGWGNGSWMVQSGIQTDLHHLTDDKISGRVRRTYAEVAQPVITQFSPFVRVRYEGSRWTGHLLSGHSRRKDFIFHEAAGWEWPARLKRSWMAGHISGALGSSQVSILADASTLSLSDRPSFIILPPSTRLEEGAVDASMESGWAGLLWTAGVSVRGSRINQNGASLSRLLPSVRLEIGRSGERWGHSASFRTTHVPADDWQSGSLSSLVSLNMMHTGPEGGLGIEMNASHGRFPDPGQLSEWALAGFDLGEWMPLQALPDAAPTPRSVGFALTGHRRLSGNWTGWVEGRVRWLDGQLLQDRGIDQAFGVGPLLPEWSWSAPHSGWLFSRSVGVERVAVDGIAWRAFLQFHHVSSEGDDVFFRHQTGFPRHRIWMMASDERDGGFSWHTRIGYVSSWTWPEYREPAGRSIPADITVDATIGKSLFSGYTKALISLLNLPDRALGNHPAGVREQLAIRLTLSISSHSSRNDEQ